MVEIPKRGGADVWEKFPKNPFFWGGLASLIDIFSVRNKINTNVIFAGRNYVCFFSDGFPKSTIFKRLHQLKVKQLG